MTTGYAVLHRPGRSGKWRELGRSATMLGALAFVAGKGQFWLRTITETVANEEHDEAGNDDELEADAAGNTSGQSELGSCRVGLAIMGSVPIERR